MGKIFWLASYPKSGNTWLRIFLENYRRDSRTPVNIDEVKSIPIASARSLFDEATGVEASDLREDEIDRLRPQVYELMARQAEEDLFMKVHDAYLHNADRIPLFSAKATAGAIYIIRNPLDVSVSFSHHAMTDIDTTIARMADDAYAFCASPQRLHNQLRQRLLSWSGHVKSWIGAADIKIHIMRYEDMKRTPLETFSAMLRFCKMPEDRPRIERAIIHSSFDELQQQEKERGFGEKPLGVQSFFRKGQIGSWRDQLSEHQAQIIFADHGEIMRRFGYLDQAGHPVS